MLKQQVLSPSHGGTMELWEKTFREYAEIVQERLSAIDLKSSPLWNLGIVKDSSLIRGEVEKIEKGKEFQSLVTILYTSLYRKEAVDARNLWEHDIKNFFRCSGYYVDILEGKVSNIDSLVTAYHDASQKTESQVR